MLEDEEKDELSEKWTVKSFDIKVTLNFYLNSAFTFFAYKIAGSLRNIRMQAVIQ